LKSRRDYG